MDKLEKTLNEINKRFGDGSVFKLGDQYSLNIARFKSGSITLDRALGGGYPKGRMVEIYGPESCLVGDTHIPFEVWDNEGNRKNHKGGTIARLYERFTGNDIGEPKHGRHLQHKDVTFYVKSVNEANAVVRNEVLDVVHTGSKPVYRITAGDYQIATTGDHKFLTPTGYYALRDLTINDEVFIHNNTRNTGRKSYPNRPEKLVKYHPLLPTKSVNGCTYSRGQASRFYYEAYLNNMSFDEYIRFLNEQSKEEIEALQFISPNLHVHHLDENFLNNSIDNLQLVSPQEHGRLHALDRHNNLRFVAIPMKIDNIEYIGKEETFDIKCAYPHNNYIANNFVVHNSGKSTLCLHAIAEVQRTGGSVVYIDSEHAFDPKYAIALGVDVSSLLLSQPDSMEQALEIASELVSAGVDLIVIDSTSAMVPRAELEGEMGDSHMGLQARLMSQACRKLNPLLKQHNNTIIWVSQIRHKIGVMFGCVVPETLVEVITE